MAYRYKNNQNTMEIKSLLKGLEAEFVGQKDISKELINKYFPMNSIPYIIGTDSQWFYGMNQIKEFFKKSSASSLSICLEHVIVTKSGEMA